MIPTPPQWIVSELAAADANLNGDANVEMSMFLTLMPMPKQANKDTVGFWGCYTCSEFMRVPGMLIK